jgi:hypothetical protein
MRAAPPFSGKQIQGGGAPYKNSFGGTKENAISLM